MGNDKLKEEYFEQLKETYLELIQGEKKLEFKRWLGEKINFIIVVLFIFTAAQFIPLFLLEKFFRNLQTLNYATFSIPTVVLINIILLVIIKIAYDLNTDKLKYAGYGIKKNGKKMSNIHLAFMALQSCLQYLKTFIEVKDEHCLKKAKENFKFFQLTLPADLWHDWDDEFSREHDFFNKEYRRNKIPWLIFTSDQEKIIKDFKCFFKKVLQRFRKKDNLDKLLTPLENLSTTYFYYIKDQTRALSYLTAFQDSMNQVDYSIEDSGRGGAEKIKKLIEENYLLYFLLGYIIWSIVAVIFIALPCKIFLKLAFKDIIPLILAATFAVAFQDAEKNVKKR